MSDPQELMKMRDWYETEYDKKIDNAKRLVETGMGKDFNNIKLVDTDESIALQAEKSKALKLFQGFANDYVNDKMPTANEVVKGEVILPFMDKEAAERYRRTNKQTKNDEYTVKQLGYSASIQQSLQQAEQGDEKAMEKANMLFKKLDDIQWEYPEQRKKMLRETIGQRLSEKGKIGVTDVDTSVLQEWKQLLKKPLDARDIPIINEIINDLDIQVGEYKSGEEFSKLVDKRTKELEEIRPRGSFAELIYAPSEYTMSMVKGIQSMGKTDLQLLIEKQK
jgi:hypothetical protein